MSEETLSTRTITLRSSPEASATPPGAQLAIVNPAELARRIRLGYGETVLGRSPGEPDGKLPEKTVSRRHCGISWDARAGAHVVSDLGSHNGSWLDGRRLGSGPKALRDGAVLRIGSVVAVYEVVRGNSSDAEALWTMVPGGSPRMARLRGQIAQAAPDPSPVLVTGATGTGKEHVVRALHEFSGRPGPFVAVNVSELSPQLAESQLFGHTTGAFTGAQSAQPGLFREAARGTLFLDEIGELALELQPKLLRVIQEHEVRPVGSTRAHRVDLRIVAATNRDLLSEVERGAFRRDLWARISLLEINVPALAERRADVLDWIGLLHGRWCSERGRSDDAPLRFNARAVEALLLTEWPENLRGVDRLVHQLAIDSPAGATRGTTITRTQLASIIELPDAEAAEPSDPSAEAKKATARVKQPAPKSAEELAAVLARFGGSVRATAGWYGRDRRQIYRWMRALGVERDGDPG